MNSLRRAYYSSRQAGIDPLRLMRFPLDLFNYFISLGKFKKQNPKLPVEISLALGDSRENAGTSDGHYFWQDLICAQWIFADKPLNHFDVGSRIDGFIAHLLTFMDVTIVDLRSIISHIPRLTFVAGDAQKNLSPFYDKYDSVSSLHSIEHFGLGRYGDSLDSLGHQKGLIELSRCVRKGGNMYISFPVGEAVVQFNAQRVIDPEWAKSLLIGFELERCVVIPWRGVPVALNSDSEISRNITGQAALYHFKRVF